MTQSRGFWHDGQL